MTAGKKKVLAGLLFQRSRRREQSGLHSSDSSSMGDIAFLLLIFFIVTSSFLIREGIFFTLPKKETTPSQLSDLEVLTLKPQQAGYMFEEKSYDDPEMEKLLTERRKKNGDLVVIISMGDGVPYRRLVDSFSILKKCGVTRTSIQNSGGDNF